MTPFQAAAMPDGYTDPLAIRKMLNCSMEYAHKLAAANRRETFWLNDIYQVNVRDTAWPDVGLMKHLSIKRRDKEPIHDWRDLQLIKNELVGAECEGVELYPAESRLVDEANQYHLFVFVNQTVRFPFGMQERCVSDADAATAIGAKQRPFSKEAP